MIRKLSYVLVSGLFAATSGCGSDSGAAGTHPGTGTGTLRVEAHIEAEEEVDNTSDPGQFAVEIRVDVFRSSTPVTDATVRIFPAGQESFELTHDGGQPGRYTGNRTGYARTYTLEVEAGEDNIRGARVKGPAIHIFSNPDSGHIVPPGEDLAVRWNHDGADEATIDTAEMDETSIPDNGTFTVSGTYFEGNRDEMEQDRISLRRTNRVDLGGGLGGSSFKVSVRNRVQFYVDILQ